MEKLLEILKQLPTALIALGILAVLVYGSFKGPLAKLVNQMMVEGVWSVVTSLAVRPSMALLAIFSTVLGVWALIALLWPAFVWFVQTFFLPALQVFFAKPY